MSTRIGDLAPGGVGLVMLAGMSPSDAYGITDLAARWGVSKPSATDWTRTEGFPEVKTLNAPEGAPDRGVKYVDKKDVHDWEAARRAAGLPLPGEKRNRGPDLRPRKRRGASPEGEG